MRDNEYGDWDGSARQDINVRVNKSCSWCHVMNPFEPGTYCRECGHRADVPRLECNCQQCKSVEQPSKEDIEAAVKRLQSSS